MFEKPDSNPRRKALYWWDQHNFAYSIFWQIHQAQKWHICQPPISHFSTYLITNVSYLGKKNLQQLKHRCDNIVSLLSLYKTRLRCGLRSIAFQNRCFNLKTFYFINGQLRKTMERNTSIQEEIRMWEVSKVPRTAPLTTWEPDHGDFHFCEGSNVLPC